MANFDRSTGDLVFILKRKPDGAVSNACSARLRGHGGRPFRTSGARDFYPAIARDLLCIAGGSGIAACCRSWQRAALERHFASHRGDVFFGVRTNADRSCSPS